MNWSTIKQALGILLVGQLAFAGFLSAASVGTKGAGVYLNPNTGRFWSMDSFQGRNEEPLSLHKYLYTRANPINGIDPSGFEGEAISAGAAGNLASGLASQLGAGIGRIYASTLLRLPQIYAGAEQLFFWAEVAGIASFILPEALQGVADFSDAVNRNFTQNSTPISAGWASYGRQGEQLAGQALQEVGGAFLGGNVSGIDGSLGVSPSGFVAQFKMHDLTEDALKAAIKRELTQISELDLRNVSGVTGPNGNPANTQFQLPPGYKAARVLVVGVPETQARTIISPNFIQFLRTASEEAKAIPIIRGVRSWTGRSR